MKSLVQCFWVLFFFAVGELIGMMIGHFLPGSVIGLILLFLALETKLIKPDKVDSVAKFLTLNMGLFFVPAGVGLITQVELPAILGCYRDLDGGQHGTSLGGRGTYAAPLRAAP